MPPPGTGTPPPTGGDGEPPHRATGSIPGCQFGPARTTGASRGCPHPFSCPHPAQTGETWHSLGKDVGALGSPSRCPAVPDALEEGNGETAGGKQPKGP